MSWLVESWERFWTARDQGHSLALFRILLGIYLFFYFLRYAFQTTAVFSSHAVLTPFVIPDIAPPPLIALLIYLFTMAVIVGFTLGCVTRVLNPLLVILHAYHYYLNFAVKGSAYDRLLLALLIIACFGDLDRVWSVTSRLRPPAASRRVVYSWAGNAIKVLITIFYFNTGLFKWRAEPWHTNEMMYWTFLGNWATPIGRALANSGLPMGFFGAVAYGTIVFELLLPFALWMPRLRIWACLLGALFHLGNVILLYIPEFLVCIATYPLFFPPAEVERFVRRFRRSPPTAGSGATVPHSA